VHVATDFNVREARDPKDLYKKARKGRIKHFTGIDSPYQEPDQVEMVINAALLGVDEC